MLKLSKVTITIAIKRADFGEVDVLVETLLTPSDPGNLCGPPEKCYPPEPAEVEIVKAVVETDGPFKGREVELTEDEYEKVCELAEDADMAAKQKRMYPEDEI